MPSRCLFQLSADSGAANPSGRRLLRVLTALQSRGRSPNPETALAVSLRCFAKNLETRSSSTLSLSKLLQLNACSHPDHRFTEPTTTAGTMEPASSRIKESSSPRRDPEQGLGPSGPQDLESRDPRQAKRRPYRCIKIRAGTFSVYPPTAAERCCGNRGTLSWSC